MNLTLDSLIRVLTEVQGSNPEGTTGKTVSYSWNDESSRTNPDHPSGFDANEARNVLGRITAITDASSATVASLDLYGADLGEKQRTLVNSTCTAAAYVGFRRPTGVVHTTSGGTRFADGRAAEREGRPRRESTIGCQGGLPTVVPSANP